MKKLIVSTLALSTLLWIGCGGDDDNGGGGGGDNTVTVTADTMIAPAMPLVYNDAAWDDVTATSISLSTGAPLPIGPVKTPMGPDKALSAPTSVELQAIKKGDRLYLRFQWADASLSMQREQWKLTDVGNFNFLEQTQLGEDQVIALFERDPDVGWDLWNWRVLTTGSQDKAEDGTILNGDTVWDAGVNRVAVKNNNNDPSSPPWFPSSQWNFTGDIFFKSERISRSEALPFKNNWTVDQTVPGWYIVDDVDWENISESRWDIRTSHNYDDQAGQWTVVMSRSLAGSSDDVNMTNLDRIKTRVGILDNYTGFSHGDTRRKLSVDFWLALP